MPPDADMCSPPLAGPVCCGADECPEAPEERWAVSNALLAVVWEDVVPEERRAPFRPAAPPAMCRGV